MDEPVVSLRVRVQPRAGRDEIVGLRDGLLVVRVKAPPTDGRANAALCRLVAAHLGLAPSRVSVRHGAGARDKPLELRGFDGRVAARVLDLNVETAPSPLRRRRIFGVSSAPSARCGPTPWRGSP